MNEQEQPDWFAGAIDRVLDDAATLTEATGPRDLEQRTTELVGGQLQRVLAAAEDGLWFDWWLRELVGAVVELIRSRTAGAASYFLLQGVASICPPSLAVPAGKARKWAGNAVARELPRWTSVLGRISATGDVHVMRDTYGTRLAVIAGFAYPHGRDPSVFLFDVDASGLVVLAGAGVHDGPEQAAAAWRAAVGDSAEGTLPVAVEDPAELEVLGHLENELMGDEPRSVMDNWFRAGRRRADLAAALHERGTPIPRPTNLYADIDISVMVEPFLAWHAGRVDPEVVDALADEWMTGRLPETWFAVSPARVEYVRDLIDDWVEDAVTDAARALLPEWARWLAERAGLPEPLREPLVTPARVGR